MPVSRELRFGFSPCPNDTFAFWGAVHGRVPMAGLALRPVLADIEALNRRAVEGDDLLEVTKLSIPALAAVSDRYAVLPAGAALGFGCGPLVVRRADRRELRTLADLTGCRVAIPGANTTAFLLLSLFGGRELQPVAMGFDAILGAVAAREVDAGLIIHESRFTYRDHGLEVIADLGVRWEADTGGPLPLGVIAARRDLGKATAAALGVVLRASVELARAQPELPRSWIRQHAHELDDTVCDRHIALYVNDFTVDLGLRGRAAVDALLERGRRDGRLPAGPSPWWD